MKKKFIIHIGPHKTGSTYIQKVLFDNQTTLSEIGIDYSSIMKEGQIAHHELAEKLHAKQYTDASNLIDQMKATQLDVLISSENFDRLNAEKIEFLAQCLHRITSYNVCYTKLLRSYEKHNDNMPIL